VGLEYVHGYSETEGTRLADQAATLTGLLHAGTRYPAGSLVLEAGCATGAQTTILAGNSPGASFVSVDVSAQSRATARRQVSDGFTRRTFTAMVEAVGPQAVGQGLMSPADWANAIRDLGRAAETDGTFCYTFFKAAGVCPSR
jgi:SAM-dependent methyltransferase